MIIKTYLIQSKVDLPPQKWIKWIFNQSAKVLVGNKELDLSFYCKSFCSVCKRFKFNCKQVIKFITTVLT